MPDARLQRTRETLPDGYQFGRNIFQDEAVALKYCGPAVALIFDAGDQARARDWIEQERAKVEAVNEALHEPGYGAGV